MIDTNNNLTLLIVEDEADLRDSLARKFTRRGFNTLTADGGHEGLQVCRDNAVDVVVTDVRMAKGTGIELVDGLRNELKDQSPAIICMSAFSDLTSLAAFQKGVDALFPKPLELETLLAAINHFASQRKQRLDALKKSRELSVPKTE